MQGLRVELLEALAASRQGSYAEMVESAQRVEEAKKATRESQMRQRGNMNWNRRPIGGPSSVAGQRNQARRFVPRQNLRGMVPSNPPNARTSLPICSFCERKGHEEKDCWKKAGKCLLCGSSEHLVPQCPQRSVVNPNPLPPSGSKRKDGDDDRSRNKPKVPARVFAMENTEIPSHSTDVIEGIYPVLRQLAKILIDPGSTHSFN